MIISVIFIIFLGLAGGVAVGSGFVAFLTVLGIIPRLTQLTKTRGFIQAYEWAVILGAVFGGWESLNMSRFFIQMAACSDRSFCGRFHRNASSGAYRSVERTADTGETHRHGGQDFDSFNGHCFREDPWLDVPMAHFCSSVIKGGL